MSDRENKNKKSNVVSNFKFVLMSQIVVLLISVIRTLIVPNFLTVEDYGYWQTYLLYISYISILCLGFNDGIYLKYAKSGKEGLEKKHFSSSLIYFSVLLLIETIILLIADFVFLQGANKIVFMYVILDIPVVGLFGTFTYYLQITNKMKKYSMYVIVQKVIFIIALIIALVIGIKSPFFIMILDIISYLVIIIDIIIKERKTIITIKPKWKEGLLEFKDNIFQGSKLMIGIYMYTFLNGICRIYISMTQPLESFSYYSFAFTISNIVALCITAVGTTLYPHISKKEKENHVYYYNYMENFLKLIRPFTLYLYYFAYIAVTIILPKYINSLEYLGPIFVIIIMQAKMSIIFNTYYKLLRQEKKMIFDNLFTLIQLFIGCLLLKEIKLILIMEILVYAYRIIRLEIYFRNKMENSEKYNLKKFIYESNSIILFMITLLFDYWVGFAAYTIYCIIVAIKHFKEYSNLIKIFINSKKQKNK